MKRDIEKVSAAIIGTGRIGTDLLIKLNRSNFIKCNLFVGRNSESEGIHIAEKLGIPTSYQSIDAFTKSKEKFDIVFDATSAAHHRKHAPIFEKLGILAIDLTPARVGYSCIPSINIEKVRYAKNINMVTCGGQASIPIAEMLARHIPEIEHLDVHTRVASDSIGPATLENIDCYYANTQFALRQYSGIRSVSVDLLVDDSPSKPNMLTTIRAYTAENNLGTLTQALKNRIAQVQHYAPGYTMLASPRYQDGYIEIEIQVRGRGDYIPEHAGNLDIINCAAVSVAEYHARCQIQNISDVSSPVAYNTIHSRPALYRVFNKHHIRVGHH